MENLEKILEDRAEMYGSYAKNCSLSLQLIGVWRRQFESNKDTKYANDLRIYFCAEETAQMILRKLSRIANGKADQPDSWADIAGYATLMVRELERARG